MRDRWPAVVLRSAAVLAVVAVTPLQLSAQEVAGTLQELMAKTKVGQRLVIVDGGGRVIKGKLLDISTDSLTLESRGFARKFAGQNLRLVQKPDPVWEGALIGGGVGGGLALWDYLIDPSEPGNAVISAYLISVGLLAGAGIDALIGGPKTLFVARPDTGARPRLSLSPVVSGRKRAIVVSLRF